MILLRNTDKKYKADTLKTTFSTNEFDYKLKSGDILSINISSVTPSQYNFFVTQNSTSNDPLLSGYLIDNGGFIEMTSIGKIKVAGFNLNEASSIVRNSVEKYLENPLVSVKLLNFSYSLLGEFKRPGKFTVYTTKNSLLDAIGQAGDFTDFANRKRVKIIRTNEKNIEIFYVNLVDNKSVMLEEFYLLPNDIIIAEPNKVKVYRQYQLPNISLFVSFISIMTLIYVRVIK